MPRRSAPSSQTRTRWRRFVDALHSNQNFEYLYWLQIGVGTCFDWTLRLMGPLLLLFASGLISCVIGMYFKHILPAMATFGSITYVLHATWALFVSFNVFFNYYHCAFTHPGKPEMFLPSSCMSDSDDDVTEDDEGGGRASRPLLTIAEGAAISRVNVGGNGIAAAKANANGGVEGLGLGRLNPSNNNNSSMNRGGNRAGGQGGGGGRGRVRCGYCKKCKMPKASRAHHCHVCDQCIMNMDHHCPWMNNCVGYRNYRYFVLFLMYMFVGCAYAALVSAPQFIAMARTTGRRRKPAGMDMGQHSAIMMTFVLSLSVGVAIAVLLGWHLYLIFSAQTTIEFYQNQTNRSRAKQWGELWSNPYDVGCKRNWQQVFGSQPFLLAVLPSRRPPPPPVVEFFPLEDQVSEPEGEWTVDEPMSAEHVV